MLGPGGVIAGWDEGLVGVQAGARVQLDIPSDLAYGAEARGEIIGENEALTFVIDVRAVIPPPDPADAPTEAGVPASEGATETTFVDLVEGDGAELLAGQTAVIHSCCSAATTSSRSTAPGRATRFTCRWPKEASPAWSRACPGMKVGGRRAIIIPPEEAFGAEGNPQMGLPADTDIVMVVDLLGVYGARRLTPDRRRRRTLDRSGGRDRCRARGRSG